MPDNEQKDTAYISSTVAPRLDEISNVYTIYTQRDNLTGEITTQKFNMPTSITGGFGEVATTQNSAQDYKISRFKGYDVNPAVQVMATVGNQKTSFTATARATLNPFPGSLPGGVKEPTPAILGELSASANHKLSKRFSLRASSKFSTNPRPDNPQTIRASALYRANNVAVSAGAVYLDGGRKSKPVVLPVVSGNLKLGCLCSRSIYRKLWVVL